MSEILAPAGDKNSVLAGVNAGADAIYLGLKSFSARSSAENFDWENFEETASYCHALGVKVYVAMNTLVKDEELESFLSTALKVWNLGADALIISDIFIGRFLKKNYPEMVLHLSTQAGVCNKYGAQLAKEYGFERVILSRETAIQDVEEIAKIIETEVFVQGALCTCFSGQCFLSSFAGGNSGNRGKCKQPCRKLYSINRDGFEENAYRLSLSDLSVGEDVQKLASAGVYSFKIEGRMRRPEYVSAAVKYYRNILDGTAGERDLSNLKRTYNRGNYTRGLACGQDKSFISSAVQGHIGEYVGTIKVEKGNFICETRQKFTAGDGFKILRDGKEVGGASYLQTAKNGFVLSSKARLKNGDKVFITTDVEVNAELLSYKKLLPVAITADFSVGKPAKICINGFKVTGEEVLEKANTRPLGIEDIKKCFTKVDKYPFDVTFNSISTHGVFIASSALNALRRKAYSGYFESISHCKNVKYEQLHTIPLIKNENNGKIASICTNSGSLDCDIVIYKPNDYNDCINPFKDGKNEKFLYLPPYLTGKGIESLKPAINSYDGIFTEGIYGFKLAEELKKPLFAGFGLNISNKIDISECNAKYISLSKELTNPEAKAISTANTFYLTAGDIKVMDLIYCPFEKKCKTCDKRSVYTLTDENGRKFPLRRYSVSACRFEVYNCANLCATTPTGAIIDCTLQKNPQKILNAYKNGEDLKNIFTNYTKGHSVQPIY
ncbi:MAG: U32 family peptidase [Clostridia bacterium]|nr:U32 family peptidase [Clostridia bacterium]